MFEKIKQVAKDYSIKTWLAVAFLFLGATSALSSGLSLHTMEVSKYHHDIPVTVAGLIVGSIITLVSGYALLKSD